MIIKFEGTITVSENKLISMKLFNGSGASILPGDEMNLAIMDTDDVSYDSKLSSSIVAYVTEVIGRVGTRDNQST